MGRKYFFNVEFFSPELKKSAIHNNRGPGGVNVSASHLPWRSDSSESGDHRGPQILAKLVFALPDERAVLSLLRIPGSISPAYVSRQQDMTPGPGCSSKSGHPGLFGRQVPGTQVRQG